MPVAIIKRDYRLTGRDAKLAEERGLASAQWYACAIPRPRLKELMRRKDGPAIRDTLIWLAFYSAAASSPIMPGALGGRCRLSPFMACFTPRPPIRAGMSAATAQPSGPSG